MGRRFFGGGATRPCPWGLGAPAPGRRITWVWIMVVSMLVWPDRSWTVRMSMPLSRRCEANECRRQKRAIQCTYVCSVA